MHRAYPQLGGARSQTTFAVVRITLDRNGAVTSKHLVWNTNDAAFNAASLRAVDRTAFAPASHHCIATAAHFDYLFVAGPDGKRVSTAIVPKPGE